jgi:hypothetical protein
MAEVILFTRDQASHRLSIKRAMLARLIADGKIKEKRIYGVSRIHRDEIDRFARGEDDHKESEENPSTADQDDDGQGEDGE